MKLGAIFKVKFKGCTAIFILFLGLCSFSFANQKVVATFIEIKDSTFIFKINILRPAPCKLAHIELYDAKKCSDDKAQISQFDKLYKSQIYKLIKPGNNFYISSNKNLGDKWLCEVSDNTRVLNKMLVKHSLAKPLSQEYKKIKIDEKKSELEIKFPKIFECVSDKKPEKKVEKELENEPVEIEQKPEIEKPKIIIELRKQFGDDFGKDFGE